VSSFGRETNSGHMSDTFASVRASVNFVLLGLQFGNFDLITKGITTYLMAPQRRHAHTSLKMLHTEQDQETPISSLTGLCTYIYMHVIYTSISTP